MERIEEFIEALKEKGIRIWSDNEKLRYQAAKGAMDSQTLEKIKEKKVEILEFLNNKSDIEVVFKSNQAERYEPFPLTNIQNSYVIGRNSAYELGDVTCHGYIEITYQEELDKEKLEMAWNKVIAKHDMLRAIIYENGYQRVQKDVPEVKIESYDLRTCSEDEQLLNLQNIRANYAEKQYPLGQWPMCDIVLSLWKGKSIIHFSLDMLITDFMSANLILNDLDNYYHGKAVEVKVETLYRDIVLYNQRKSMSKSKERKKAERYWQDKIRNMGTAPELIINNQKTGERETFKQLKFFIDEEGKENINEIAKELRVTASTVILTAFGEVINKWSKNSKFSINMTMLSRDKTIPGVDKVVGDFTDVNVYSMDYSSCKSFESRILENQVSLWEDLQNNAVSGIEVLRELGREKKENVMIPIVYTSTLGVSDSDNSFLSRSNISYKISQTPQVWIDCQIAEENGGVAVNWDYRTGVFLQNVIRDMFEAFERVLKRLGKKDNTVLKETDPIGLPEKTQAVRNKVNVTERELPESLMAEGFVKSCVLYPNKTALITKDGEYTYAALKQYVSAVQHTLLENGLKPGDSAAVMLPKGIWQIAGVLGTLLAGGVYLPIDSKQPLQRRNDIIQDSGVKFVLTEKVEELYNQEKLTTINVNILDATTEYQLREIAGVRGSDPAYIIYTSGTTGKPKGVVISHEAAMNTIYDVIERFSLNRETVILGLSNLAFDLSVFDIFGCFQVGGTLVLPDDELKKNPKHILDLIIINRVTVLNAVPAQMKMLDSYMDNAGILEISWVKLIIMSGDWIPVGLPENLFKKFTNAIVVSMGGATECAIWSIFHIIPRGYEKKNSIPYGKPLSNQKFYILNAGMEDCPDGVSGDIYIAGKGLAKEYFKDKEMTDQKFIFLPRIGERIYKTGDVGQYDEAGIIEFLGRSDNQVKVRGHRIELTEIDSILSENKELDDVVSIIVGDAQEDRRIVTVAVPKQAEVATEDTSQEIANIKNKEEELTKEVNKELLSEWVHAANKVVLSDIFLALYGKGVFTDSNRLYTYEEIVKTLNIPNKLYKLMHRWLTVLCNEKIVVHRDGGYCVNLFIAEQYKNNKKLWDEMYSIEGRLHYSQKLLDYLKTSSDVLPELMAGKEDPLNLLFPKGEMDVAMAAYHDNIINRIMNGLAKEEIEFLALDNRRTPIRILEVGAGVGGTSVDVIPSLDGTGAEYYFTDLSAFFLNNAREKFSGYEWVKYNIFDINKDIMEQTIAPFSVDIILAANVLHNAKNIHYVLENLKKLLKPNGTIIILEETLEAYTLLTSMEFKDGLTGFTDERAENNQTFFKREQWEGVFKEHKADIVYQFPEKGTPLEMAGQTIYVVRFKENYICPDKNNMLDELERRIPEYMIPSVITFLPRLPQTSNDKIDRGRISKWISASAEENKKVDVAELPQNDLEEQIARIWCKELNIERIGRNDNFYLSGGDSLLIAQVIARMRETIEAAKRWSWDDLLKEMMKTPTIRGVAKILSNQAGENEQDKSLVIIKEAAESSEKKVTVVFHAGTGTLTPYNSLIAYITERSQENEAVMGFTFGDEAEYLAIPTDKIFENLGKKYGRILSELGFTEYTLIGHCVGGLIALETAHYLKDKGKNVSSVTLLSTSIPHKKEETVLADLDMKIFETAVQTSLYNELLLERTFASLIDADIKKAGHQVDNDTLQQVIEYLIFNNGGNITVQALCSLTGKFAEVGAEFQRLHSMSATERMNDLYTTIERPNGQLMEHQRKMLNVLFRVFAQNFRCVSSYIPKVYTGKMRVFDCESAIANFFPSLFSEDKKTWEQYAQGEFLFDTMKGDHISCMNSPYIEENVKKILDL